MTERPQRTVLVGMGDPLMGDDAFGLAAVARLRDEWTIPSGVQLVDCPPRGSDLLRLIEEADRLLLIDDVESAMPPGTEVVLARDEVPRYLARKAALRRTEADVTLALAALRGTLPRATVAIGMQPGRVAPSGSLSPRLDGALDRFVGLVVDQLRTWGHACVPQRRYGRG